MAAEAFFLSPMAGELARDFFNIGEHDLQQNSLQGIEAMPRPPTGMETGILNAQMTHPQKHQHIIRQQSDAAVKDFLMSPMKQVCIQPVINMDWNMTDFSFSSPCTFILSEQLG